VRAGGVRLKGQDAEGVGPGNGHARGWRIRAAVWHVCDHGARQRSSWGTRAPKTIAKGRIHYKTAYAPPATRGLRYETVINLVVGFEVARSFPKSLKIAASTLFVR